jgi:elongation factor P--(R)-beta-lysine ligase
LRIPFKVYELEELFFEISGINPFKLNRDELFQAMKSKDFTGIDGKDDWNSLFFKLFIQEIELKIVEKAPYFIKDWPLSVSTMAKKKDVNKVERFELYINGVEIANGYTELLNPEEQRNRFVIDNKERARLGKKTFKSDEEFLKALSKVEGPCTGVSIGVDRLLMVLLDKEKIDDVMIQRFKA